MSAAIRDDGDVSVWDAAQDRSWNGALSPDQSADVGVRLAGGGRCAVWGEVPSSEFGVESGESSVRRGGENESALLSASVAPNSELRTPNLPKNENGPPK